MGNRDELGRTVRPVLNRRQAILRMASGVFAPSMLLQACDAPRSGSGAGRSGSSLLTGLAPVDLDSDRIIQTVVCLRPYRPSGFRLEPEQTGTKLLIHNYGHGGGGFTLSWGTASLAVDLLQQNGMPAPARAAVLGCGVIGLSTALLLTRRGIDVTIYARDLPPNTTSNLAGASFYPSHVIDDSLLTPEFRRRLNTACRISHRAFQRLVDEPRYGVRWQPQYFLTDVWNDEVEAGPVIYQMLKDLYPNPQLFGPGEHPFRTEYVFREDNLFIGPAAYLQALLGDFRQAGGGIEVRMIRDRSDVGELPEPIVFNCTALGAMHLTSDPELTPLPGQHVILRPQPEVDYAVVGDDGAYMFPRSDGVVLGYGEGIRDPNEMLERHRRLVPKS